MDEDQSRKSGQGNAENLRKAMFGDLASNATFVPCVVTNIGRKMPRSPSEVALSEIWYKGGDVPIESGLSDMDFTAFTTSLLQPFIQNGMVRNLNVVEPGCLAFETDVHVLKNVQSRMFRDRMSFAYVENSADAPRMVKNACDYLRLIRSGDLKHAPRPYLDS